MRALSRPTKKVLTILMQDGMEMVGQSLLREVAGVVHANDASGTGAGSTTYIWKNFGAGDGATLEQPVMAEVTPEPRMMTLSSTARRRGANSCPSGRLTSSESESGP